MRAGRQAAAPRWRAPQADTLHGFPALRASAATAAGPTQSGLRRQRPAGGPRTEGFEGGQAQQPYPAQRRRRWIAVQLRLVRLRVQCLTSPQGTALKNLSRGCSRVQGACWCVPLDWTGRGVSAERSPCLVGRACRWRNSILRCCQHAADSSSWAGSGRCYLRSLEPAAHTARVISEGIRRLPLPEGRKCGN